MPNKDTQIEGNVENLDNQTFTQEQVNSIVGKEKEKCKSKYANFDEYKKAFDELNHKFRGNFVTLFAFQNLSNLLINRLRTGEILEPATGIEPATH